MTNNRSSGSPRIALFHPCLIHGGIPRVFVNLAQGFLDSGIAVDMVQATPEGGLRDQVPSGVRLIDLNASRALTSVLPLMRYLRRERPDAMIAGGIQTNIAAVWARQLTGIPVRLVLTEHNIVSAIVKDAPMLRTRVTPIFLRCFYRWAEELVAVSEGAAADLASILRVQQDAVRVIYNPVISPEFWLRSKEPLVDERFAGDSRQTILAVGRLHYHKDYPTLLNAFATVRKKANARLVFLGDGEERERLAALARHLEIESSVEFIGSVKNPLPYMRHSTVLALSSVVEALPTVLIEALAVGLPVVATDCPSGPREILCDGAYGTMVPVGDSSALAEALLAVLTTPHHRSAPPSALQRFAHDTAISKYLDLLGIRDHVKTGLAT
jgi:glycosyltransferase involved in cell wall biosynthesis